MDKVKLPCDIMYCSKITILHINADSLVCLWVQLRASKWNKLIYTDLNTDNEV